MMSKKKTAIKITWIKINRKKTKKGKIVKQNQFKKWFQTKKIVIKERGPILKNKKN
jgi:hypothetical protein